MFGYGIGMGPPGEGVLPPLTVFLGLRSGIFICFFAGLAVFARVVISFTILSLAQLLSSPVLLIHRVLNVREMDL